MKTSILSLFFILFTSLYTQTTNLVGVVKDELNAPIANASVIIKGTEIGSTTNQNGVFNLNDVPTGSYNIEVSYTGYTTETLYNVIVKSKGNPELLFFLQKSSERLSELTISSENRIKRKKETPLSTQTLSAVEIATYPGGNNDVVQVAQTLAGVSPSIGGFRNDLIIRGGAPNESVYYLDGIEVPNINHFGTQGSSGGPVGMINVSFINDVTLSTSAFEAQYDNPLSGVLQFNQRNGNSTKSSTNIRISASEAAITTEGPLFKKNKEYANTTYIASVRRSYLQFLFSLIGLPIRPNYWDYQYKINHKIDDYNSIQLIGLGSIDDFSVESSDEYTPERQAQLEQSPFIEQRTNTIGINWKNRFKNGNGFMQTTLSNNFLQNNFKRYADPINETGVLFNNDSKESETKLRYELTRLFDTWKLKIGSNLQRSVYTNATINNISNLRFDSQIDFFKYGFFANATTSLFQDKLDVSLGFRMDDDTFTQSESIFSTFSPRIALNYEMAEDWFINASVGRYFKLPPYTILGFRDNANNLVNQDVDYTQSDHYVLGLEHFFSRSSNISVEGFYKNYKDYPVSVVDGVSLANKGASFEVLGSEEIVTVGKGRTYGLEFQFQQKLANNFYGTMAYTWFYSEFTGLDSEVYLPSVWDSRHLLTFTGGLKLKRDWEISSRYRFAGKTPFVPVDADQSLATYPELVLEYNRLGEEKLDSFSQLDVRIDKKWNFNKYSLNIFLEAQNVLSQTNPVPPEYGLDRNEQGEILTPQRLTQIERELGRVLPSIGIVVDF